MSARGINRRALLSGAAAMVAGALPLSRTSSGLILPKSAEAQYALDPIIVTAPAPPDFLSFHEFSAITGPNFSTQSGYGPLLQYNSYKNWYLPQRQAYLARQYSLVIQGDPPPIANPWQQYVGDHLATQGLYTAEALAVAFFLEGAGNIISEAYPALRQTASQLVAEGIAASSIAARITLMSTGFFVGFVAVAGVLVVGLAVIGITMYYVYPEIQRQIRATSNSPANYSGMLYLGAAQE